MPLKGSQRLIDNASSSNAYKAVGTVSSGLLQPNYGTQINPTWVCTYLGILMT